jgi:hypothetical protein
MSVTNGLNGVHQAVTTSIADGNHQLNGDIGRTVDQSELNLYHVLPQYHSQPKSCAFYVLVQELQVCS